TLAPIPHEVVWDAELSAAAALAVAATLEFASVPSTQRQQAMFLRLSQYWFAKKDWAEQHGGRGAHTANTRAIRCQGAVERTAANQPLRRGACQSLTSCATALHPLAGEPVNDWLRVRSLFRQHAEPRMFSARCERSGCFARRTRLQTRSPHFGSRE